MIENEKFYSIYARLFDKDCATWERDREFNKFYVRAMEEHFNDILKYRGYVFLRDVYERFGWPVTLDSIKCGWRYDTDAGYRPIKFTIFVSEDPSDPNLIIDFNVDGDITKYFK